MFRYGATIFLSAFLLFQIQPMIARLILPWFGGTAAVWTTCMMFFQTALLLGYLYAHLLRKLAPPKIVIAIHIVVLAIAAIFSSVIPPESLKPMGDENLTVAIVTVLLASIGLPFFALSSTGPLVQAWQSTTHENQSPYRLYALSNLGSMLALISYPFLVERFFPLARQAHVWKYGFVLFAVCCGWCGWQTFSKTSWGRSELNQDDETTSVINIWTRMPLWILLSMSASIVLLATTNLMCQEVASVPFLWILPLVLYLLSFIICFDRPALYRRRVFVPLLIASSFVAVALVHLNVLAGLLLQVAGLATFCFSASMTCHGELERLKPHQSQLTAFYLWVAVGGALGGIFVCVVAPNYFAGFYEFHIGVLVCLLVALSTVIPLRGNTKSNDNAYAVAGTPSWTMTIGVFVSLAFVLSSLTYFLDPSFHPGTVFRGRNEYGLAAVVDEDDYRKFINGSIEHGGQSLGSGEELDHISYYVPGSGVALAFDAIREDSKTNLNVGVIGLGAGAMATWLQAGDEIRFYEINPMVEMIAKEHFSFLKKSLGKSSIQLGDGRIQLQKELEANGSAQFDLLFIDAFSSDSIPVHLLTTECMKLYLEHLNSHGILIAHITNRFVDLRPVLLQHAKDHDVTPILVDYISKNKKVQTQWVLLTRNESVINSRLVTSMQSKWPDNLQAVRWTDDYASLAALLNWSAAVDVDRMALHFEEVKEKNAGKSANSNKGDSESPEKQSE
ncbi:MAG: spermidine synthase [Mariniblastus sp.]